MKDHKEYEKKLAEIEEQNQFMKTAKSNARYRKAKDRRDELIKKVNDLHGKK